MKILFVHRYFPGQYKLLAKYFLSKGFEVKGLRIVDADGRDSDETDVFDTLYFGHQVKNDRPERHLLRNTEQFIREAASAAMQARELAGSGWHPDIVYSFTGWGSGIFLKELFPKAIHVKYLEWYYNNTSEATEYLTGPRSLESRIYTNMQNIPIAADSILGDLLTSPTHWQKSQFPATIAKDIQVIADGLDLNVVKPQSPGVVMVNGLTLEKGRRYLTYVARGSDPFRGFKQFIEALGILQKTDLDVQTIIVGDTKVYYGQGSGTDSHYRDVMSSANLDEDRVHFVGRVPYDTYLSILDYSTVHLYLTVPFVLSWSMLEAMAKECLIVASRTAPVLEFIEDGVNGILADFSDPEQIANKLHFALINRTELKALRLNARKTVFDKWNFADTLSTYSHLISKLTNGNINIT